MVRSTRREVLEVSGAVLGGIAVGTTVTAATSTDRFLVRTKGRRLPRDVEVVHEMPGVDVAVVAASESTVRSSRAVTQYAPDVEVELDAPEPTGHAPVFDESDYEGQPGDFLQWDKDDLEVPEAHETTEGEGTRVAVIDSGVLETHPDLAGPLNLELSRNFTGDGGDHNPVGGDDHGTHVAGIVAADDSAGLGVDGTAPKTDLVDCRVFSGATASFGDILAAVVYSANVGADVANLSLGAYPIPRQGVGSFYGQILNSTMTYANEEGTLLVVAAGNDSADLQHDGNLISLPNEGAQAVSVAATGPIGYGWNESPYADGQPPESPAFYTNYGTNAVTLGAPGGDASLAAIAEDNDDDDGDGEPDPGGPQDPLWFRDLVFNTAFVRVDTDGDGTPDSQVPAYGWKAGTSMAAPNVAGAAALVKSANPNYNANQLEAALERAADVPDGYERRYYGSGYLNVLDAL